MAEYRLSIPDWPKDERPRERAKNLLAIKDFIIGK
jgi:hypothetical protein